MTIFFVLCCFTCSWALPQGARKPISMMDGYNFNGAKGYKDSKLALMMLSNMLHDKYNRQVTFPWFTADL